MKTKVTYATDLLVTIDLPPRQLAQENRPNQTIDFKGQATSLPLLPKMARAGECTSQLFIRQFRTAIKILRF